MCGWWSELAGSIESTTPSSARGSECLCDCAPPDFSQQCLGQGRGAFPPSRRGGDAWSSRMGTMYFEDLTVGDNWTSAEYTVDHEEMLAYGRINDPWPFHANPE